MIFDLIGKFRGLLAGLFFVGLTFFVGSLIIITSFFSVSVSLHNWLVWFWATFGLRAFGVRVISSGLENIPRKGALFLFNHTSHFDILILQSMVPRLRFGAKIELFKIPVFGAAMRRAGVLPITRNNREKVFQIYQEASARVEAGACFALAPEGTRQDSEVLGSFKTGPFVFAINAKMPVVPVVIKGAHQIMPKHTLIPNVRGQNKVVSIHFLPPIPVQNLTIENRHDLQTQVRKMMDEKLKSLEL